MSPAAWTTPPPSIRFIARLKDLCARSLGSRQHKPDDVPVVTGHSSPAFDPGDLAVAQFVHDLRNQLTVVVTCAEDIVRLVPRGCADQEIAELRARAERASLLARELLMAARPRTAVPESIDLNEMIAAAGLTLSGLAGRRIRLHFRLSAQPVTVMAERMELERILLNLTLNACEAMADGGVLTIETAVIERCPHGLPEDRPQPWARLRVSDTGRGMTPEVRGRIFEPFFTTKRTGTGLGMSSVALTVGQLEGTLAVDTQCGRGTTVTVHLPVAHRPAHSTHSA